MYLKEIALENFKSFGTKVRIPFLPGFTAITGPNGSGKSNIIDAILFVLGVRSPKMVRAERLSDLIYKGEKNANYCKVSLVFDNTSREIPVDSDEIVLTRKIKLAPLKENPDNYYSYFYINGRAASLNEFVTLLSSANISSSSIVQQGDVTAIVEMGNVQRRKIIDEIAGIAEFDKEIEKARKEREEVERNMEHIDIILGEVRRQIRQLKKERDEAVKYKQLVEAIERYRAMMAYRKRREIEREISEVERQIQQYERNREEHEKEIQELKEKYRQKQIRFQEIDDKLTEMGGEELLEIKSKIDFFREESIKAKEKINYYRKELAERRGEAKELEANLKKVEKEAQQYRQKIERMEKERVAKEKQLKKAEEILRKRREEIEKTDEKSVEIGRELAKIKKEYEKLMNEIHEVSLERDRLQQQMEMVEAQLNEVEQSKNSFEFELKEIKWEMGEIGKEEKELRKRKEYLEKQMFEKKKEEAEISQQLRELEKEMIRLQRELSQLRAKEDVASISAATREILRLRDEGIIRGIHGMVAELGKADEEYQRALEVAAGRRMEAVVVDSDDVAAKCISYLKEHGYGRVTFLPLNKLMGGKPRGKALLAVRDKNAIGFAIDLIHFDEKYRNAFWYVFGDTIVVNNLDAARSLMGGVRLVTLDGELIEASGAITGGSLPKKSIFGAGDARRISEIAEELRNISAQQEMLSHRLIEVKDEMGKVEEELRSLPALDMEKMEKLEIRRREMENKLATISGEVEKWRKEYEEIKASFEEMENKLASLMERKKALEEEKEKKESELLRIAKKEALKEIEEVKERIETLAREKMEMEGNIKTLNKEYEIVMARGEEIRARIDEIHGKIEEMERSLKEEEKNREEAERELKTYQEMERKLLSKTKGLTEERDALYKEIVELENRIDSLSAKIETAIDIISRAKARLPALESALAEYLDVEHEFKEEELLPVEEIKRKIKEMEETLQKIEPVNMRALEEYERQEERRAKFEEDMEHLREQKKNLMKLEREMEKKKKETFLFVFEEINRNFAEIYRELADGEGELTLDNPENPFDGGLSIKVRPAGKRMLHLNSLSGGEKSIASLAFIFALQAYEPSPFYVLDEIDMFLDEKNAERVAKIISQRSSSAQFIVISLRRITLKHADHIYGVTINDNVSTIIGNINLVEAEKMVEIK